MPPPPPSLERGISLRQSGNKRGERILSITTKKGKGAHFLGRYSSSNVEVLFTSLHLFFCCPIWPFIPNRPLEWERPE